MFRLPGTPRRIRKIAWCSGRTGLPQIYTMDSDGTNVQRLTDGGYATSPSWSPNGQFLAFAWNRKYGPGAPAGRTSTSWTLPANAGPSLTHDEGRQDFPILVPGWTAHIVFQREKGGGSEVWTMLSDGNRATSAHPGRRKFDAQLELEVT